MNSLLAILIFLFALVSFYKPKYGAVLLAALAPFYILRFTIVSLPTTFLEIAILILFISWLTHDLKNHKLKRRWRNIRIRLRNQKLLIIIFIFLLAATISVFVAPEIIPAIGIWRAYFIEPLLVFIVFLAVVRKSKDVKLVLVGLGISVLLISVWAIIQKFTGLYIPEPWQAAEGRRVISFFSYPNAVGLYLAPLISLFFVLLISKKEEITEGALKLFYGLVVILGILALVFAVSEGAILALLAAFVFALLFTKWRYVALGVLVLTLVIVFLIPLTRDYSKDLISFQDVSGDVRLALWEGTFDMVKDNPVLGVGLTGFEANYTDYKLDRHTEILVYPHNIIFNFWTETGLLGLVGFILLLEKFFLPKRKKFVATLKSSPVLLGLACAAIAIIVHGLVDVPYFKNDLALIFWILLALLSIEQKILVDKQAKKLPH